LLPLKIQIVHIFLKEIFIITKTTFYDGFAVFVGAGYHGAGAGYGEANDRRGRD
jgi:hypothetical protein